MKRNTGGAIGISLVSNMLNSRKQTLQAYLNEHFTVFSAWGLDQMASPRPGSPHLNLMQGLTHHQTEGFALVYQNLQEQASLLACNDIYRVLAFASLICIPIFLFPKKSDDKAGALH